LLKPVNAGDQAGDVVIEFLLILAMAGLDSPYLKP
jgi:hypothetical protein